MTRMMTEPAPSTAKGDDRLLQYKRELHQRLISSMDLSVLGKVDPEGLRRAVRNAAEELTRQSTDLLNLTERERLIDEVMDETFGLGPLENLMRDPTISDIMINGPKTVYVERKGRLERSDVVFGDEKHLLQIVQRIAGRVGRRVDETTPMVDARMADGSRLSRGTRPWWFDGSPE